MNGAGGKQCDIDEAAEPCARGGEHINRAGGRSARWTGSPEGELRARRMEPAGAVRHRRSAKRLQAGPQQINQCAGEEMDRQLSGEIGNASDLELLQKTFDRMK